MTNPAHVDPFMVVSELALALCDNGGSFCQKWAVSWEVDIW